MNAGNHAAPPRLSAAPRAASACGWLIHVQAALLPDPAVDDALVGTRLHEDPDFIQAQPWSDPDKTLRHAGHMALRLLFKNEQVEEAKRLILACCTADRTHEHVGLRIPNDRCEALLRICFRERTRKLLAPEAAKAIEDYAWDLPTKCNAGISKVIVDHAALTIFLIPNNGQTNRWRRHVLALQIVRRAKPCGWNCKLDGVPVEDIKAGAGKAHAEQYREQLYNTHDDPSETRNLGAAHPEVVAELRALLRRQRDGGRSRGEDRP